MTEKSKKYLSDILIAINHIDEFTKDILDFNQYILDHKTQSAVERKLAIIGEAMNKLRIIEPEIEIENANEIIGLRNRIIHSYDNIDNSMVWAILSNYLEKVKKDIEEISGMNSENISNK